ncbi:MAG: BREX-1 system adenine-specific DNA-methyltransferase PglX [Firmicutes bacterium]|nr:BREX-1 system adenine-specific DNA-methyltransferase PglX [Bacillota bacterium]
MGKKEQEKKQEELLAEVVEVVKKVNDGRLVTAPTKDDAEDKAVGAVTNRPQTDSYPLQEGEKKSSPYGKFADAESLYQAYRALESEFTRRSQESAKIKKELEEENNRLALQFAGILSDEDFLEKMAHDERITERVIRNYLTSKLGTGDVPMLTGGGAPCASSVKKPKTLEEAKALAELMLQGH